MIDIANKVVLRLYTGMNFRQWIENEMMDKYVSYTGVVLHPDDRQRLLLHVNAMIPYGWDLRADHMTINMKSAKDGPASDLLGKEVEIIVKAIASDKRVIAVAVDTETPSTSKFKHITIALGPEGKSQYSNELINWKPITPIKIKGIVKEVETERETPKIRSTRPLSEPAPNDPTEFVKIMQGKPLHVIQNALRGKFPEILDSEIDRLLQKQPT